MMCIKRAIVYAICTFTLCNVHLVSSAKKNFTDFDLDDSMEFDYYDDDGLEDNKKTLSNFVSLEKNQINAFDWKEKIIRTALSKALTNKDLRQKFVEVMPILRVLSSQQRLALSSIISAHVNSRAQHQLKFDQVKTIFGDEKSLILPLLYDIANLVRSAAQNYIKQDYDIEQVPLERRSLELMSNEDDSEIGVASFNPTLNQVFDVKAINEALMENVLPKNRAKRSTKDFVHKLIRAIRVDPNNSLNNSNIQRSFDRKLNTTQFAGPYEETIASNATEENIETIPYQDIEELSFSDINGTEVLLNSTENINENSNENLPTPDGLVDGPRFRIKGNKFIPRPIVPGKKRASANLRKGTRFPLKNCERFSASMCIRTDDYPIEQIIESIKRHKHAMSALLAEYRDNSEELEYQEYLEELQIKHQRREDENIVVPGGMCSSVVRYARPQKARSAAGEWKFILNTGQHTQTLRLEKCSNPQESCSYLSQNYRSRCIQVYNYHRLLSWDEIRGLHVDIFKIPTCCSCHVDGYKETYPPLGGQKTKDYTPIASYKSHPYSTFIDEFDNGSESEENNADNLAYRYLNGFKRVKIESFDPKEQLLSSSNIKSRYDRTKDVNPTIASYLSPPGNDSEGQFTFKRGFVINTGDKVEHHSRVRIPITNSSDNYLSNQDNKSSNMNEKVKSTQRKRIPSNMIIRKPTLSPQTQLNLAPIITAIPTTSDVKNSTYSKTKSIFNIKSFNNKLNGKSSAKRINYNYHPIIEFFENQQQHRYQTSQTGPSKVRSSHRLLTNTKDVRMGGGNKGTHWHPMEISS